MDNGLPIVAASGLDFEATAARGFGIEVVSGLNRRKFLRGLLAHVQKGARGIISFGVAGGLLPDLVAGQVVVASRVHTASGSFQTCGAWSASLLSAIPHAKHLPVFGVTEPVLTPSEKAAIFRETGSVTVDLESRDVAEVATHYGLPFTVLRAVADPAHRAIPLSAFSGVDEQGRTCALAALKALAQRPQDVPTMILIACDGLKANLALRRARGELGPLFGLYAGNVASPGADEALAEPAPADSSVIASNTGVR
jgi:adenosylhomocysteine nucleosidase